MKKPKGSATKISPKTKQKIKLRLIIAGASVATLVALLIIYINFFDTKPSKAKGQEYQFSFRNKEINAPVRYLRSPDSIKHTRIRSSEVRSDARKKGLRLRDIATRQSGK